MAAPSQYLEVLSTETRLEAPGGWLCAILPFLLLIWADEFKDLGTLSQVANTQAPGMALRAVDAQSGYTFQCLRPQPHLVEPIFNAHGYTEPATPTAMPPIFGKSMFNSCFLCLFFSFFAIVPLP